MVQGKLCLARSEDLVSICHIPVPEAKHVREEYPVPKNQPREEEDWVGAEDTV